MFTGIIKDVGTVTSVDKISGGLELQISTPISSRLSVDESVSVSGICLTVVESDSDRFRVQCVGETLRKTTVSRWERGTRVNLEPAVSMEKALDGHLVQGHVDTTGEILDIRNPEGADRLIRVGFPEEFQDLVVDRGSITLDGISLTLAQVGDGWFDIAIIPYTWEHTTLERGKKGETVNLEFDLFGKYVVAYLKRHMSGGTGKSS